MTRTGKAHLSELDVHADEDHLVADLLREHYMSLRRLFWEYATPPATRQILRMVFCSVKKCLIDTM